MAAALLGESGGPSNTDEKIGTVDGAGPCADRAKVLERSQPSGKPLGLWPVTATRSRRPLQQFANDSPRADRERSVQGIANFGLRIDAQAMKHRGVNVDGIDFAATRKRPFFVRRADHATALNAAARQQGR